MSDLSKEKRERLLRIIAALLDKTVDRGCMPAEAAGAAAKVQELLERYQLDITDVQTGAPQEKVLRHDYDTGKNAVNPGELRLFAAVARGFDCKHVVIEGRPVRYALVGFDSDCQVALALFRRIFFSLSIQATEEGRECGEEKAGLVRFRNQFLCGAAGEIEQRLREARRGRQEGGSPCVVPVGSDGKVLAGGPSYGQASTALVLAKEKPVQEAFDDIFPRSCLSKARASRSDWHSDARDAGRRAGRSIALSDSLPGPAPRRLTADG